MTERDGVRERDRDLGDRPEAERRGRQARTLVTEGSDQRDGDSHDGARDEVRRGGEGNLEKEPEDEDGLERERGRKRAVREEVLELLLDHEPCGR